jgi:AraC-like DNA-binding protein
MEERLAEADNDSARIGIIDEFLCSRLIQEKPDALVCEAISRIRASNGISRIKPLTDALYISQDALEKRFRKVTGTSPKQFSFIVKMRSLLTEDYKQPSMLPLALENGFYDQPHFIRAFKVFTGLTPTVFLISGEHW